MLNLEEILVKRPVILKVRVTEDFRQRVAAEIRDKLNRLEMELQQLEFLQKRNAAQPLVHEADKKKIISEKQVLLQRLKEIGSWTVGEEVYQGTIESLAPLKVGQSFSSLYGVEVVLEDDRVIAIRQHEWRRETNE